MSRTVLAIDTATTAVVTGVVRVAGGGTRTTLAARTVHEHRRHAEILTTLISEVLAEAELAGADLDAVVVGAGPGPFTGLRVGMATAAAYGDALGLPVHGVCTLDALAVTAAVNGRALAITDARRREVYWARYVTSDRGLVCTHGPDVAAPAAVAQTLAEHPVDVVAGPQPFVETVAGENAGQIELPSPTPSSLVAVAALTTTPGPLEPMYLRRPDAVELKDQRRKSLLGGDRR